MPTTLVAMTDEKSETPEQPAERHEQESTPGFHEASVEEFFAGPREAAKRIAENQAERPMRTWEVSSPVLDGPVVVKAHAMLMADDGRVVFMRIDESGNECISQAFRFAEFGITLAESQD
jgi:hypothetical protein